MDFAAFPPEINSGLMYAGPGSSTMLAASAAWDGLAAELRSAATGYGSAILDLTDAGWQGPSSASMAAAAAPYVAWLHNTAEQAEQAGMQAAAAAAAHEAAFAATVPPAVIAANRSQLMVLIASNVMGIHTPAIAATEAQYGEMWAQDAAAMYAYAASSVMAATLAPMAAAPATTNPVGLAGGTIANLQGAAQGLATQVQMGLSAIPSELNAAGSSLVSDLESGVGNLANLLGMPFGQGAGPGGSGTPATPNPGIGTPIAPPHMVLRPPSMPATPALPTMRVTPLMPAAPERLMPSAALGQATSVGGLSVPSGWSPASAPSAATPAVAPLMGAPGGSPMAARSIPATTVGGMEMRAPAASEPPRVSVLARSVVG